MKLLKQIILIIVYVNFGCKESSNFIPEQDGETSDYIYEMCVNNLRQAYSTENDYLIAFNLTCLNGPNKLVKKHLQKAFQNDTSFCNSLYESQNLADQGFFETFYKYDTLMFRHFMYKCNHKEGEPTYYDFRKIYDDERIKMKEIGIQIDSSIMDKGLIDKLELIHEDDQKYRKLLSGMNISSIDKKLYENARDSLDSINLYKIVEIIKTKGYPQPEVVGQKLSDVTFLVIHHQKSVGIRNKYRSLLAKNTNAGLMMMYDRYTEIFVKENTSKP